MASSVVGVAIRTRRAIASSISVGSASSAAPYRCSPGRNMTTKSGAESSPAQYALSASDLTCLRSSRAWSRRCCSRSASSRRLVGVEHALQRRLGVDDDVLAAGQADDQVRAQHVVSSPASGALLDEVAVADHPGELDHVAQLHLAPLAAGVRLAQRGDQRAGLGPQPLARSRSASAAGPRAARATRAAPGRARAAGRRPGPSCSLSGADKLLDRLLALVEVALGLGLRGLKLGAGHLGQLGHARLQRLGAQRLERRRTAAPGRRSASPAAPGQRALVLEVGAGADELALELGGAGRPRRPAARSRGRSARRTAPAPASRPRSQKAVHPSWLVSMARRRGRKRAASKNRCDGSRFGPSGGDWSCTAACRGFSSATRPASAPAARGVSRLGPQPLRRGGGGGARGPARRGRPRSWRFCRRGRRGCARRSVDVARDEPPEGLSGSRSGEPCGWCQYPELAPASNADHALRADRDPWIELPGHGPPTSSPDLGRPSGGKPPTPVPNARAASDGAPSCSPGA